MIVILQTDIEDQSEQLDKTLNHLSNLPGIEARSHQVQGTQKLVTEVYLIGDTARLSDDEIASLPLVERVVRVSQPYRILGRHKKQSQFGFDYNGVHFSQDTFHLFAGLCAVDNPTHVEIMMKALKEHGQVCTRMGAYKPRTNPYSFQGHGKDCLPYVFELAGKYGIKVIAMEITHDKNIDEINEALELTGHPTGVMLQIGTRNTQNFELLKAAGKQKEFPILFKRGFGITLEESLNAAEYLASSGNSNIIFCLRGMKTHLGDPHRNFVDFAHVPVLHRLTRMPVCVDPSHSVGSREASPDNIMDVFHVATQGIISGANMVLMDFHPAPAKALVDGPQAMLLREMEWFIEDLNIAREAYLKRKELAKKYSD